MAGKPQPFKRTRRGIRRGSFSTHTPKMRRRRFLNELRRTNNVQRACKWAGIYVSLYEEWRHDGFLTEEMLDGAERTFRAKHPQADILVSDVVPTPVEARGYSERDVLNEEGWISIGGYDEWD